MKTNKEIYAQIFNIKPSFFTQQLKAPVKKKKKKKKKPVTRFQ